MEVLCIQNPWFFSVLDSLKNLLEYIFQTDGKIMVWTEEIKGSIYRYNEKKHQEGLQMIPLLERQKINITKCTQSFYHLSSSFHIITCGIRNEPK